MSWRSLSPAFRLIPTALELAAAITRTVVELSDITTLQGTAEI